MKIGILLISTNKYHVFLQPLIDSIKKYFFVNNEVTIYLFTDSINDLHGDERVNVVQSIIPSYKFPYATLYRYKIFSEAADLIKTDYIFYSDVDMLFVDHVGEEILPSDEQFGINGLTATLHPGFYKGGGSWCTDVRSNAYVQPEYRKKYYAGGFQGGKKVDYLMACQQLAKNISIDYEHHIMAEWHDESHWNKWVSYRPIKILDPSYCMVEQEDLRVLWGIDHLSPKLIALKKEHKEIRS